MLDDDSDDIDQTWYECDDNHDNGDFYSSNDDDNDHDDIWLF